jgi:hypothetical protein
MTSTPNRKSKNITFEEKYEIIKDREAEPYIASNPRLIWS